MPPVSIFYQNPRVTLLHGDVLETLRAMEPAGAQTIITSPPYWGLRDYQGVPDSVWGGREDCSHRWESAGGGKVSTADSGSGLGGGIRQGNEFVAGAGAVCLECSAWRGQLGLEPTPEMFVAHMVGIFDELKRHMTPDGTAWVNLGDTYAGSWGAQAKQRAGTWEDSDGHRIRNMPKTARSSSVSGVRAKSLVGIPWRFALAMMEDGWIVRSEIIWHKPNAMPESMKDRPTKAHETIFLLALAERYYYDAAAIAEWASVPEGAGNTHAYEVPGQRTGKNANLGGNLHNIGPRVTRNKRTVWTVPTAPFADAHFACFPPDLIKPCVLAGSRPGDLVMDPFVGSGTTAMVARDLGRRALGIDASDVYLPMATRRVGGQLTLEATS